MTRKSNLLVPVVALLVMITPITVSAHENAGYSHDSTVKTHNPNWLTSIKDDTLVSQISWPGTHDSMSFFGGDIVQTQTLSLDGQLESGVRVLDIRCRHIEDIFAIHHGSVFQNAFFGDVLNTATAFLRAHPGETILMRVKEEYEPHKNTRTFEETFRDYYWTVWNASFWKPTSDNPRLGDIRGKIVVLQNFPAAAKYGIDYNTFSIQDDYVLDTNWELYDKWTLVKDYLDKANNGDTNTKYMNYLSGARGAFPYFVASGHSSPQTDAPRLMTGRTTPGWKDSWPDFPRVNCFIGICSIAFEGTNVLTYERLDNYKRVGVIMADFPGPGLIERVIARNNGLKK